MPKTLRKGGSFLSLLTWLCCVLVFLSVFSFDGARADSNNTSGANTADGQTDDGEESESLMEKGMEPFYGLVKNFLTTIQPNKISEQTWLNLSDIFVDGKFRTEPFDDWKDVSKYLVGYAVCAAIGVVFFIAMPIIGLVFCCCRCCGRCGGKPKPQDPKRAGCKRKSYCTLLLVFNTFALAAVVCTFLSNQLIYDKLSNENNQGPVGRLSSAIDNTNEFINNTIDEVDEAVLQKFLSTKDSIIQDVRESANQAIEDVLALVNASTLIEQARGVSEDVNKTFDELQNVADQLDNLTTLGDELNANLSAIGSRIQNACSSPPGVCGGLDDPSNYATRANFSALGRLSNEARRVNRSIDLGQLVAQAQDSIDSAKNDATTSVNTSISDASSSFDDIQTQIEDGIDKIEKELTSVSEDLSKTKSDLQDAEEDISENSKYAWYGGIALSCVLLLVVVLYYMGVLFGLCGERPGHGAQCCNRGTGASFLMGGVAVTFLLSWLIMLVCVVLFITGGPVYSEVCQYFDDHNPRELQPFSDALISAADFQKILFEGKDVELDIVDILEGCKNNSAVYSVLHLANLANISEYTDLSAFETELDKLSDSLSVPRITIVTAALNNSVNEFINSDLNNIPFSEYYDQTGAGLTTANLTALAQQLRAAANNVSQVDPNAADRLNQSAADLEALESELITPMRESVAELNRSLTFIQFQAETGIPDSTSDLLHNLQAAEDRFNNLKDDLVVQEVNVTAERVLHRASGVVQTMLTDVNQNIGRCRPVYDSFYEATDAVCMVVLDPLNALWFSIGWCLFCFVFCLIFAVKLAGLYRREHSEHDFDDPNFTLYGSGGSKQDAMPLTSQDRGRADSRSSGVANAGFMEESYMGPRDGRSYPGNSSIMSPGYNGHAQKYGPPPYLSQHSGMGGGMMNGHGDYDYRQSRDRYPY